LSNAPHQIGVQPTGGGAPNRLADKGAGVGLPAGVLKVITVLNRDLRNRPAARRIHNPAGGVDQDDGIGLRQIPQPILEQEVDSFASEAVRE
jgi:hypothetical protein